MNPETAKKIILFDGVCNLCNRAIQFTIKHDKTDVFRFAPLQSEIGKELMKERGIISEQIDSIILIEPGMAYYTRATAALKIGKAFGGLWKILGIFEWVPAPISNVVYDFVAKNRYRWFGRREQCMVPTSELEAKFLS